MLEEITKEKSLCPSQSVRFIHTSDYSVLEAAPFAAKSIETPDTAGTACAISSWARTSDGLPPVRHPAGQELNLHLRALILTALSH